MTELAVARARIQYLELALAEARAELFIARNHRCRVPVQRYAPPVASPDQTTAPAVTRPYRRRLLHRVRASFGRLSRRDRQLLAGVFLGYLGFLIGLVVFS